MTDAERSGNNSLRSKLRESNPLRLNPTHRLGII
jgi:hypothetical protein